MASIAEHLLKEKGYEGIYQLASFHPMYRFANAIENDAADYTNRSIYPMLHLLRESSIDKAFNTMKTRKIFLNAMLILPGKKD